MKLPHALIHRGWPPRLLGDISMLKTISRVTGATIDDVKEWITNRTGIKLVSKEVFELIVSRHPSAESQMLTLHGKKKLQKK